MSGLISIDFFFFVFLLIFLFAPVIEIKQEPHSPGLVNSHTGTSHQKQVKWLKIEILVLIWVGDCNRKNICANFVILI